MGTTAEKLTYLNTTKGKIKDSINNIGGDITNQTTFREYATALDYIFYKLPKVSGSGIDLSLTPTLRGKILSSLKGNTSQNTLSGKNLFDLDTFFTNAPVNNCNKEKTTTGIKLTFNAGTDAFVGITYKSGTTITSEVIKKILIEVKPNTNYTISLSPSTRNSTYYAFADENYNVLNANYQPISNKTEWAFTTPSTCKYVLFRFGLSDSSITTYTFSDIQLEEGSTATSYEPYCGGIPSPNPDYPQAVNIVSGDNDIQVCGKNLFDKDNTTDGGFYANGFISNNSWCYVNTTSLKVGETYFTNKRAIISFYNGTTHISYIDKNNTTFTIPANTTNTYISTQITDKDSIQIEYGNQATTYEAYTGSTYNIDLPVENLLDDSTYQLTSSTATFTNHKLTLSNNANTNWSRANYKLDNLTIGQKYTLSCNFINSNNLTINLTINNNNNTSVIVAGTPTTGSSGKLELSFTAETTTHYVRLYSNYSSTTDIPITSVVEYYNIQFEKGLKSNTFTPYGTTPIELNKIPNTNYEDRIFHAKDGDTYYDSLDTATKQTLTYDKWYLHKETNKYNISSSTVISITSNQGTIMVYGTNVIENAPSPASETNVYCQYLVGKMIWQGTTEGIYTHNKGVYFTIKEERYSGSTLDAYLNSLGMFVIYPLATATNTEITYTPLIEQLNTLEEATSYEGTTNINQVNNDLPFNLDISVLMGN